MKKRMKYHLLTFYYYFQLYMIAWKRNILLQFAVDARMSQAQCAYIMKSSHSKRKIMIFENDDAELDLEQKSAWKIPLKNLRMDILLRRCQHVVAHYVQMCKCEHGNT